MLLMVFRFFLQSGEFDFFDKRLRNVAKTKLGLIDNMKAKHGLASSIHHSSTYSIAPTTQKLQLGNDILPTRSFNDQEKSFFTELNPNELMNKTN